MKKIGIITFHASLNCGSMLQAFALSKTLEKKYNADVEIINFSNFGQRNYYANWDFFPKLSILKNNIKSIGHYDAIERQKNDYEEFSNNYLNKSGKLIKHRKGLKNIDKNYDIVIAGGDQVWNVRCRDADEAYFLSFVHNAKKVAYSPSLGARNINKCALNPKKYADLIKQFDYLSVREKNGQKWLKELTDIDIPLVADPTLLFSHEEWKELLPIKKEKSKEKFILYYAFSYTNDHNNKILQKLSEKMGMPVYIIDRKSWTINKLDKYGIRVSEKSGPIGLLNLMENAEISLVQSFHGIVFSALFHKKFWSLRNSIIKNVDDDRAKVILEQLGLEDRAITYDSLLENDLNKEFDYEKVDKKIEALRTKAYKYIDAFMEEK